MLVPRLPLDAARRVALLRVSRLKGVPLGENPKWPFALAIGSPITHTEKMAGLTSYLSPDEAARVSAGEGRLVYSGQFVGGDPEDDRVPRFSIMIDAFDGRVLSIRDWGYGRGGEAGRSTPVLPLAVPTSSRDWRVAFGEGNWSPHAKASLTPTSDPLPTGEKLTLTDGKAAFPATYDPKSDLLGIMGKAYRPGPTLAGLLRQRTKV